MNVRRWASSVYQRVRGRAAAQFIDRKHTIETAPIVGLTELGLEHPERGHYAPASWRSLSRALPLSAVGPDDVFVDIGCGMGRVVYLAALRYPFRRVIGVELSTELLKVARANIEANSTRLTCTTVDLIEADATEWQVPDDVTIVYLHNPLHGASFGAMLQRVLESVERQPRRLRLLYLNPTEHDQVVGSGRFRRVRTVRALRPTPNWSRSSSTYVYEATV